MNINRWRKHEAIGAAGGRDAGAHGRRDGLRVSGGLRSPGRKSRGASTD